MKKFLLVTGFILILVIAVCGGNFINNMMIGVTEYLVVSDKLPKAFDNYKIAFLSDFHNAPYAEKAAEKTAEMRPDAIMLTGDMINMNEENYDNTRTLIERLVNIAPVYMVSGNHEMYHPRWKDTIRPEFEKLGVHMMDIQGAYLEKGGSRIHLYGMQDPSVPDAQLADTQWLKKWEQKAGDELDKNTYNILLSHRANYFDSLAPLNYDLVLSGHLHGGVLRLPFLGGLMSPDQEEKFPKYTMGKYYRENSLMIVSRGMDFDFSRMRVFNGPELVEITLRQK